MTENHHTLEALRKRIKEARLQLQFARNRLKEVDADRDGMPSVDGSYACRQALRTEILAVKGYLHALQEYHAALLLVPTPHQAVAETANHADAITPRERQVLTLIASGKSSKQIAKELGISFRTSVCHRYRIQKKLNAHNTADLTRAAIRMGLIELQPIRTKTDG